MFKRDNFFSICESMSSANNSIFVSDGITIHNITGLHYDDSVNSLYDALTEYFEGPGVHGQPHRGGLVELLQSLVAKGGDIDAAVSGAPWVDDAEPPICYLMSALRAPNPQSLLQHWHHQGHGRSSDEDSDEDEDPADYCALCKDLKPVIRSEILDGIQWLQDEGVNTTRIPNFEATLVESTKEIDKWVSKNSVTKEGCV
jgi:hypothetical protein